MSHSPLCHAPAGALRRSDLVRLGRGGMLACTRVLEAEGFQAVILLSLTSSGLMGKMAYPSSTLVASFTYNLWQSHRGRC